VSIRAAPAQIIRDLDKKSGIRRNFCAKPDGSAKLTANDSTLLYSFLLSRPVGST
jgi:hypothetical protein